MLDGALDKSIRNFSVASKPGGITVTSGRLLPVVRNTTAISSCSTFQ
jgi:hypothetical protein